MWCGVEDDSSGTTFRVAEQAKCCWITGVGDRILDSFCLALIGSILSLSVLIRV